MTQEGVTNERLQTLQKDVDETAGLMVQNIEKAMERGENLTQLQERSEGLEEESLKFKRTSAKVKKKMWWQNKKWLGIGIGVGVGLILIIVLAIVLSTKPWKD